MNLFERWASVIDDWFAEADLYSGPPRWSIDLGGLSNALTHLGLTWDLTLCIADAPWEFAAAIGVYYSGFGSFFTAPTKFTTQEHLISIRPGLPVEAASMCLWHELTHAKQAEKFASPWGWWEATAPTYDVIPTGSPKYYEHPAEVEAFTNMDLHYEIGSLAMPA